MLSRRKFILSVAAFAASYPVLSKTLISTNNWPISSFVPNKKHKSLNKNLIPDPIFDKNPQLVNLYWEAWEQAWDHVKHQQNMPQSPYMDEAFSDDLNWIWDTCFMVHFCRYAPKKFPGIESLDNFYEVMYDGKNTPIKVHHIDNPPLFAWTEIEYFKLTGDKSRILHIEKKQYLQKHFEFFNAPPTGQTLPYGNKKVVLKKEKLGFIWNGNSSGMDNTPRGRSSGGYSKIYWLDALAQQGLSAKYIVEMAKITNNKPLQFEYEKKYHEIKQLINNHYWDEEEGFYFDINKKTGEKDKVWTPASYWVMLAEMCTPEQATRMLKHVMDPQKFGGKFPWVTLSRDDKDYDSKGQYWRGGIWLPTAYMGTKALEKYGFLEEANELATNLVNHIKNTYIDFSPHTIWEAYSPSKHLPSTGKSKYDGVNKKYGGNFARPHFCGWSALGPISMLIENVIGFYSIDASNSTVTWRLSQKSRHGIKNLIFGNINTDIIYEDGKVFVKSNKPYTLKINGSDYNIIAKEHTFIVS
ncbi:hypothetical protein D5R81_14045 [Parashewanella spongiae]|uniref:Mannosylglycerate hydrolase MGH1-like glycoside hydrolase domain-containing protein n=1 Tax=Parashewanella spongiae TaxID=342950 RepID=A0A3A6TIZ8_9GAMM|nr:trehalase family glycosidase [Parashewanella spongiae]MCL1079109.1 hypothetical protein [Parashewanella spongiae]RJY10732.1 hypothetical protein D5R81_14045 [Parashewanella spongiae]